MREILNPTPTFIGKMEEKRRVIHMRIKLGNKTYKLRKEAKDLYLELICCGIWFTILFALVSITVHIANTICPL